MSYRSDIKQPRNSLRGSSEGPDEPKLLGWEEISIPRFSGCVSRLMIGSKEPKSRKVLKQKKGGGYGPLPKHP